MTRLGENVFRFDPYNVLVKVTIVLVAIVVLFIAIMFIVVTLIDIQYYILNIADEIGHFFVFFLVIISAPFLCIRLPRFLLKDHVILDKEENILSIFRWTWKGPFRIEDIPLSEIMGTNQDETVTTNTSYNENARRWETKTTRSYTATIHGKFGSRKIGFADQDDWNLFMILLYGDNDDADDNE